MIYMRFADNEKYVILINPPGNKVKAELTNINVNQAKYVFGTSEKCIYKIGKGSDEVTLPAVSAAIYKIE